MCTVMGFTRALILLVLSAKFSTPLDTVIGGHTCRRIAAQLPGGGDLFAYATRLGVAVTDPHKAICHDILAAQVWPASRALAYEIPRLTHEAGSHFGHTPTFCEFGGGGGLVSLAAAREGCDVLCTDVDELSPLLVRAAADVQGLTVRTAPTDLTADPIAIPSADLYVMADVFVTNDVAVGAARCCWAALQRGSWVVVAAQQDRVCRVTFLEQLRAMAPVDISSQLRSVLARGWVPNASGPLGLFDVDESTVKY